MNPTASVSGARSSRILASQSQAALHIECATRPPKSSAASTRTVLSSPHPTRLNSRQRSRVLKTSSRCSTRRISGAARWAKTQKNGVTAPHKPSCSHWVCCTGCQAATPKPTTCSRHTSGWASTFCPTTTRKTIGSPIPSCPKSSSTRATRRTSRPP